MDVTGRNTKERLLRERYEQPPEREVLVRQVLS